VTALKVPQEAGRRGGDSIVLRHLKIAVSGSLRRFIIASEFSRYIIDVAR